MGKEECALSVLTPHRDIPECRQAVLNGGEYCKMCKGGGGKGGGGSNRRGGRPC